MYSNSSYEWYSISSNTYGYSVGGTVSNTSGGWSSDNTTTITYPWQTTTNGITWIQQPVQPYILPSPIPEIDWEEVQRKLDEFYKQQTAPPLPKPKSRRMLRPYLPGEYDNGLS